MEDKLGGLSYKERLTRLELIQENLAQERRDLRQSVDELTIEIRQQFEGINGQPGVTTRLDRLEQLEKIRSKWFWLAVTTSFGAFITAIAEFLLHK